MGIFKKIFGLENEKKNEKQNRELNNILGDSIILELEEMKQKLLVITMAQEGKAKELEEKIREFEDRIMQSKNDISQEFVEFKKEFEKILKPCEEKYYFDEVKRLRKELDKIFYGSLEQGESYDGSYESFEERLEILKQRTTNFTQAKQQLYIAELIKAKYRLQCCKLQDHYTTYSLSSLPKAPKVEKVIYATMLVEDIQNLYNIIPRIKYEYKIEEENYESISELENSLDEILNTISNKYPENLELSSIFEDQTLMEKYISIATAIRQKRQKIKEDIQTIKAKRKEKERCKTLTQEEMAEKIAQIDDKNFDITKSYIDIINYEKMVAEAKGLLFPKNTFEVEDMEIQKISNEEVALAILRGNELGINYSILLNIDDSEKNNILIYPKGNKDKFLKEIYHSRNISCDYYYTTGMQEGKYSPAFLEYFIKNNVDKIDEFGRLKFSSSNEFMEAYEKIENIKIDNKKMLENVKVALQIPYLRPMIPILEKLKENGIEYYIPILDSQTSRKKATKEIYIDRKDLEKYKNIVHPSISTKELGEVKILSEDVDLFQMIINGVNIPEIEQMKARRKQQNKLKSITEEEVREQIKRIDDASFDITESYKNILEYQKNLAIAKGLLNDKNTMSTEDIDFFRVSTDEIGIIINEAKKNGITYTILMNVDDNSKGNNLVIVTKNKKEKLQEEKVIQNIMDSTYTPLNDTYGKSFIYAMQQGGLAIKMDSRLKAYYSYYLIDKGLEDKIKDFAKMIQSSDNKQMLQDIKCYIEVPYLRSIIPILEEFNKAGIEYYIPPIDRNLKKTNPTIKIYFDRKDIEEYKQRVHDKISNIKEGLVIVGADKITYPQIMLEGTDSPYIRDKKDSKKER